MVSFVVVYICLFTTSLTTRWEFLLDGLGRWGMTGQTDWQSLFAVSRKGAGIQTEGSPSAKMRMVQDTDSQTRRQFFQCALE